MHDASGLSVLYPIQNEREIFKNSLETGKIVSNARVFRHFSLGRFSWDFICRFIDRCLRLNCHSIVLCLGIDTLRATLLGTEEGC